MGKAKGRAMKITWGMALDILIIGFVVGLLVTVMLGKGY